MKTRQLPAILCAIASCAFGPRGLAAPESPQFTNIQKLANSQGIVVTFTAPTGSNYRVETSTTLPIWNGLVTLPASSATSLQCTDSAAPFFPARAYRALQLPGVTNFTGNHLPTTNGDVIMHPVGHATLVMTWNGLTIYNDPTNGATAYTSFPRADLILVSHDHGDHFSGTTIDAVRGPNGIVIVPGYVYTNNLTAAQRGVSIMLTNGANTNVLGLNVESVPAYNGNHARGRGNGYVVTLGGRRIYLSGDTGNVPEMHSLPNIDVAFLCINTPYTMTASEATNAVRDFRPAVVYPYHYRDQSGAITNAVYFKQLLGTSPGIEVRLRKWY